MSLPPNRSVPVSLPPDSPSPSSRWKRVVLLANAGAKTAEAMRDETLAALEAEGVLLHADELVEGGQMTERVRHAVEEGADLVLVAGGDGTLRLAAEALVGGEAVLGVLPQGTGNNFARDLGLPLDLPGACRAIAQGAVRPVEVAAAEFGDGGRFIFINSAHIGLFGLANEEVAPALKRRLGYFAYAVGAWTAYRDFEPFHLTLAASRSFRRWRVVQASVTLGRVYAGGFGDIPGETLHDGRFTLTVFRVERVARLLWSALRVARAKAANPERVHRYRLAEARLEATPPQQVNLDGELLGETPVTFRVLPDALRVIGGDEGEVTLMGSERGSGHAPMIVGAAVVAGAVAFLLLRRGRKP